MLGDLPPHRLGPVGLDHVGRFGGVVGADVGKVWPSLADVDLRRWAFNPTIGLRFYLKTFVVANPPRRGLAPDVRRAIARLGASRVAYVSCDPATQMRDLTHFLAAGYTLAAAQPFDLFPQTAHLELVATFLRSRDG